MITDCQTNFLYIADQLPQKYSEFYSRFQKELSDQNIRNSLLSGTKDVWAVDYMPIQCEDNRFVKFFYKPDYLKTRKDIATISDADAICKSIGVDYVNSHLVIDGGNVIRHTNIVVMCDKVFKDNPHMNEVDIEKQLINIFKVDKLIFIPTDPADEIGHADGLLRFVDEETVLINNYRGKSLKEITFQKKLKESLINAKLNYLEIPYNPYSNHSNFEANGVYMNYLQMEGIVILPIFNIKEDEFTVKKFEDIFPGQTLRTIESNAIAKDGGVLNCITWNIKK